MQVHELIKLNIHPSSNAKTIEMLFMVRRQTWQVQQFEIFKLARHFRIETSDSNRISKLHMSLRSHEDEDRFGGITPPPWVEWVFLIQINDKNHSGLRIHSIYTVPKKVAPKYV